MTTLVQTRKKADGDVSRLRVTGGLKSPAAAAGTQIIAIYGKGGIGKSFTLANLSYMLAQQGKRVLADRLRPQERHHLSAVRRQVLPHHHRDLGSQEGGRRAGQPSATSASSATASSPWSWAALRSGAAAAGEESSTASSCLEKLGFHEWGFDYVLLDFLGDVVCGGFGLPIARDMCQKVIVVGSNDLQSLYVANNVCSAVNYFRKMGGAVGVAGLVINKDDGTGEAQAFAKALSIPVLASIPANEDIRKKSANYEIIGRPGGRWAPMFEALAGGDHRFGPADADAFDPGRPAEPVLRRQRGPRRRAHPRHRDGHGRRPCWSRSPPSKSSTRGPERWTPSTSPLSLTPKVGLILSPSKGEAAARTVVTSSFDKLRMR